MGSKPSPTILGSGVGRTGCSKTMRKRSGLKPLSVVITVDSSESTVNFYETHAREYFDRTVSADLSALYEIFLKHVRPGGRVLGAGCGAGRDLKILQARGFDAVGIGAHNSLGQ